MISHDDCRCIDDSTDLFMIFFHVHVHICRIRRNFMVGFEVNRLFFFDC